jgi:SAM-dependent methyltransferase
MEIKRGSKDSFTPESYGEMNRWFQSALGQHLLATERAMVEPMLTRRFGYHLLQLGCADLLMHDKSPMGHKFSFRPFLAAETCHTAIAPAEAIPLASESVDLVLLHHALDFSGHQHHLLREVARVLIAGGHIVIVGFNPLSSWGLRNRLQRLGGSRQAPWHASLLGTLRLTDWLKLLDFQVEQIRYGVYSLPVNSESVIRYSGLLDGLATRLNWPSGGIYAISARKQVLPLTPVQSHWRKLPVHGLGLPLPEKVSQASREWLPASNEDSAP